jgi:imidazolonepropionase-like amidohydrolase
MAGMSNYEALQTATVNPAQALGFNGGTIEAGKLADLVMVDGDPLTDINDLLKVRIVVRSGKIVADHRK